MLQSVVVPAGADPFSSTGSQGAASASPGHSPRSASGARTTLLEAGAAVSLSTERRNLHCSVIALTVKLGLVLLAGVSLMRLAGAYQERMDRQGELSAVLQLEQAKLAKARERFDSLFGVDGEQRLIREQNQWIAPNRLRVVWKPSAEMLSSPSDPSQAQPTPATNP
ncbi:MAG: hypothetical protein ACK5GZ_05725 [Cyanobium sp.]